MVTTMKIGSLEVTAVVDHVPPPRDVQAIYPDVPADAWDPYREMALDSHGHWQTQYCAFLIRPAFGTGSTVLVDSGMGAGPHEPDDSPGKLLGELGDLGVPADRVDAVVTTHPHGDHVGWNVSYDDAGSPAPTFGNAFYYLGQADWDYWTQPEIAEATPPIGHSIVPLDSLGVLRLVDGVRQIAPGVSTLPANGHTPGHQCVLIESGGQTGVVIGDLIHNVAQVTEQEWCPAFDWNQEMARAARRDILGRAASDGWTVFAGHLEIGKNIGKVVEVDGRFSWQAL